MSKRIKNVLLISNGLHLQCNKGFLALQLESFCIAKVVLLECKEALNEDWGSILRLKTDKNSVRNLQNRFFICNTFLLPVRYLHPKNHSTSTTVSTPSATLNRTSRPAYDMP